MAPSVKPDEVLSYTEPTKDFLCGLEDNTYNIHFQAFKIRDMTTKKTIFEVDTDKEPEDLEIQEGASARPPSDVPPEVMCRTILYDFPKSFLDLSTVGTTLVFSVGDQPVPNFRMIERHYFEGRLVKSFDFQFGFCIPGSTNSWEAIYDMPDIGEDEKASMVDSEEGVQSDSFYFVNDQLIMHNKAAYNYTPNP